MNRIIHLDIIKATAAYLVCIYHLTQVNFGSFDSEGLYIPNFNKFLYGFCSAGVPLFFMISGTILKQKRDSTWQYFAKKALNQIKVYLIWGGLMGSLILFISKMDFNTSNFSVAINYLWYFQSLAILYLFSIIWLKIQKHQYSRYIPYIIFIYPFCVNLIFDILTLLDLTQSPIHTGFFRLYSILYFLLPYFITNKYSIRSNIYIIIGLLLVYFEVFVYSNFYGKIYDGVNSSFPTIGALCITIGVYQILSSIKYNPKHIITRLLSYIGKNCLGIYIFHMPLIVLFKNLYSENICVPTAIAVSTIIVTLATYIFVILKRCSIINWTLKL